MQRMLFFALLTLVFCVSASSSDEDTSFFSSSSSSSSVDVDVDTTIYEYGNFNRPLIKSDNIRDFTPFSIKRSNRIDYIVGNSDFANDFYYSDDDDDDSATTYMNFEKGDFALINDNPLAIHPILEFMKSWPRLILDGRGYNFMLSFICVSSLSAIVHDQLEEEEHNDLIFFIYPIFSGTLMHLFKNHLVLSNHHDIRHTKVGARALVWLVLLNLNCLDLNGFDSYQQCAYTSTIDIILMSILITIFDQINKGKILTNVHLYLILSTIPYRLAYFLQPDSLVFESFISSQASARIAMFLFLLMRSDSVMLNIAFALYLIAQIVVLDFGNYNNLFVTCLSVLISLIYYCKKDFFSLDL